MEQEQYAQIAKLVASLDHPHPGRATPLGQVGPEGRQLYVGSDPPEATGQYLWLEIGNPRGGWTLWSHDD